METWQIVLVVVVVVVLAALVALAVLRSRRRARLRYRFGAEYDRTAAEAGGRRSADAELAERERRHARLDIRALSSEEHSRFTAAWARTQAQFVDDPHGAVTDGDRLVTELLSTRGYPTENYEQQLADLSVDHADVLDHYRQAHELAGLGEDATTEELRRAMMHQRTLFDELLEVDDGSRPARHARPGEEITPAPAASSAGDRLAGAAGDDVTAAAPARPIDLRERDEVTSSTAGRAAQARRLRHARADQEPEDGPR